LKTTSELQVLARKFGWQPGPLTYAQIKRMSSDEALFHERLNKEEFERALAEPALKAKNHRDAEAEKVQRQFEDKATPEEHEAALKEVTKFVAQHPQFKADLMDQRTALINFLKERRLPVTQANLTDAFQILGREGKLTLNPSAVGIIRVRYSNGATYDIRQEDLAVHQRRNRGLTVLEPETEISGSRLAMSGALDILLSPHSPAIQEGREQAALSADDYKKQNPEAFLGPTPALIEQKFQQATATFLSFHPEYVPTEEHRKHLRAYIDKRNLPYNIHSLEAAYADLVRDGYIQTNSETVVSAGGGTKLFDYGAQHRGNQVAELPEYDKSLAYKIRSMSAKEYADFIANPTNRRAVDEAVAAR
jgi:hypothetical protein